MVRNKIELLGALLPLCLFLLIAVDAKAEIGAPLTPTSEPAGNEACETALKALNAISRSVDVSCTAAIKACLEYENCVLLAPCLESCGLDKVKDCKGMSIDHGVYCCNKTTAGKCIKKHAPGCEVAFGSDGRCFVPSTVGCSIALGSALGPCSFAKDDSDRAVRGCSTAIKDYAADLEKYKRICGGQESPRTPLTQNAPNCQSPANTTSCVMPPQPPRPLRATPTPTPTSSGSVAK